MKEPCLVFRFEGVVTQTAESALLCELAETSGPVSADVRVSVRDLASEMRAGRLGWMEFCAKGAFLAGFGGDGSLVAGRTMDRLNVAEGIEELFSTIARRFSTWFFCEIAKDVLAPVVLRMKLDRFVPGSRWLFSSGRFRAGEPAGLIKGLVARTSARREELLWIDDRSSITASVIRAGMNAVAYVDPFRLRRNLELRGLLK